MFLKINMKKLMRPRDRILLLLASTGDILSFLHNEVGIGQTDFRKLYGWMPTKQKRENFRQTVWRMLKTGYLEKIIKKGQPYLRLTSSGKEKLIRDFPLFAWQKKKWDKKWRMVIFDIEEIQRVKRRKFRDKMKELGLGMLQKSVYLTPFDIGLDLQEFIDKEGLKEVVFVLEVSVIADCSARFLAQKVWSLEKINRKYKEILKKTEELRQSSEGDCEKKLKELKEEYFQIVLLDPCLPKELLPKNWLRCKTEKMLMNY